MTRRKSSNVQILFCLKNDNTFLEYNTSGLEDNQIEAQI